MITPDEQILICAVRYALGRQSYIVGFVAEYVTLKRKTLSHQCTDTIIQDIEEEFAFYHRQGRTCGMEYDERTWTNLLKVLKEERQQNEDCGKTIKKRPGMR